MFANAMNIYNSIGKTIHVKYIPTKTALAWLKGSSSYKPDIISSSNTYNSF